MSKAKRRAGYALIGTLPAGDWRFCLVSLTGQADVIVVVDKTGANAPRMIIGDKIVNVEPL